MASNIPSAPKASAQLCIQELQMKLQREIEQQDYKSHLVLFFNNEETK